MGTDIHGWIEVRPTWVREGEPWRAVVRVDEMVPRDYDAFQCLFGVTDFAGFRPIAARRGLPDDCSDLLRRDLRFELDGEAIDVEPLDPSWLTARDAAAIDMDEAALRTDTRIHKYRRSPDGTLEFIGKAGW